MARDTAPKSRWTYVPPACGDCGRPIGQVPSKQLKHRMDGSYVCFGCSPGKPASKPRPLCESTVLVAVDMPGRQAASWKCRRLAGHEGQHTDKAGRTWGPIPLCHDVWITGPGHTPMECTGDLGHDGPHRCGDVTWRYADMCGITYNPTGAVCTREPGHDGGHDNGVTGWMDPADKARAEAAWKQIAENPELLPCGHVFTKPGATGPDEHTCTRAPGHDGLHEDRHHAWGYATNPTVPGAPTCGARWLLGLTEVPCQEPRRHWGPHRTDDLAWTFTRHATGGPCNATSPNPPTNVTVTCTRTDPHSGVFDDREEGAHSAGRLHWVDESEDSTPHDPNRDAACSTPAVPAAERDAADSTPHDAEQQATTQYRYRQPTAPVTAVQVTPANEQLLWDTFGDDPDGFCARDGNWVVRRHSGRLDVLTTEEFHAEFEPADAAIERLIAYLDSGFVAAEELRRRMLGDHA